MSTAIIRYEAGGWPEWGTRLGHQPGADGLISGSNLLALAMRLPHVNHREAQTERRESERDQEEERWERM